MFVKNISDYIESVFGFKPPESEVKKLTRRFLTILDDEGFNRSIIFKTGCIITSIQVKNYPDIIKEVFRGFKDGYESKTPPTFSLGFSFGKTTLCLHLNEKSNCSLTEEICSFFKGEQWWLCEVVYSSLEDDKTEWK